MKGSLLIVMDLSNLLITINEIDESNRVDQLKTILMASNKDHKKPIIEEATLKDAHIYCIINHISAQQYGPLLQHYIIQKFGFTVNKAKDTNGDCSKDGNNFEVKVSLGGSKFNKYNYVQIRPSHNIQYYLLTAYHVDEASVEIEGSLFIFKVSKEDMNKLLVSHGSYAHGTKKEHGTIITLEELNDDTNKKEYALRPSYNDRCWKDLLPHQITEAQL